MLQQIKEVKAGNQITFLLQSNGLNALKDFIKRYLQKPLQLVKFYTVSDLTIFYLSDEKETVVCTGL